MKKIIAFILALTMIAAFAVGCGAKNDPEVTEPSEPTQQSSETGGTLMILDTIWNGYSEDEVFAAMGGNPEDAVDGAPGLYNLEYKEGLCNTLALPEDQLDGIVEAATLVHMMNANVFTAGVLQMKSGTDLEAMGATVRDALNAYQWMCGAPEKMVIATFGEEMLIVAFGATDTVDVFAGHIANFYGDATVLYNENLTF